MDIQFKEAVWEVARKIPFGRVSTYGAIAKAIGYPNHSRHVGKAMGGCPKDVPAYRVIAASGILRVPEFEQRLTAEGIIVINSRIKNFKKIFWNPLDEINF
ncbi:MGMT family protein [Elizabethkingia sp. JS20170427COW]|uniref:MGMT family protein n=1 Tax=Elizabethkingia sp. JS20170427COW TaxID=2583851 RepID=UPI00111065CA|nr:MGMT family protein [Elizabethkingia sp. JS20170427COW]QCX52731.1 cysteine methyltransferase [Elizabethkingia sp. JS20170427COW]